MRPTEVTPGSFQFKHYIRTKQAIAHEIRTLREFLKENVGEREAEDCRQLMTRLAEDRFTLAVVGQLFQFHSGCRQVPGSGHQKLVSETSSVIPASRE